MDKINERELVERLEAADAREFALLLARPTAAEERAYRVYLGNARYQRLHDLAVQNLAIDRGFWDFFKTARPAARKLGNVVVLPGIMGSELTTIDRSGYQARIWLNVPRIVAGQIERLRLSLDGRNEYDPRFNVEPTGILKAYYGELILSLSQNWNVHTFWFDWRKNLNLAADALNASITRWFGDQPVHLVAHSMGGLVARTFIHRHPAQWEKMKDKAGGSSSSSSKPPGPSGGRLVMLGTPNHGSYLIPQAVTGLAGTIRKLETFDPWHDMPGILQVVKSFAGLFQMLPSPQFDPTAESLYDTATYPGSGVFQALLDQAADHHKTVLDQPGDPDRMSYIAGWNQTTIEGIDILKSPRGKPPILKPIDNADSYLYTTLGDGSVTHELGLLDGLKETTYFVESEHSALTANAQVLGSLDNLLQGRPISLSRARPKARSAARSAGADSELGKQYQEAIEREVQEVERLAPRIRSRGILLNRLSEEELQSTIDRLRVSLRPDTAATEARNLRALAARLENQPQAEAAQIISTDERKVADLITRELLAAPPEARQNTARASATNGRSQPDASTIGDPNLPRVEIRLRLGSIAADKPGGSSRPAVDVISVGHYEGTRPATTVRAIDQEISKPLQPSADTDTADTTASKAPDQLLLSSFIDRKILRGQLGQPFFLDDPRVPDGKRLLAIAGMGVVGSCGVPELTVLVRELVWSLNRIGRSHLATVLIGAGQGNLTIREAVEAWVRGIRRAYQSSADSTSATLTTITFVEFDAMRLAEIDTALQQVQRREADDRDALGASTGIDFAYTPLDRDQLRQWEEDSLEAQFKSLRQQHEARWKADGDQQQPTTSTTAASPPIAVRMVVGIDRDPLAPARARYRFSAMTDLASIPEREVVIDPLLIQQANDELAGEADLELQKERGHLLGQLLIPQALRSHLNTDQPLVLVVDSASARIHWELIAQPDPIFQAPAGKLAGAAADYLSYFLGTYRGLTRQFRSTFASPPEPDITRREALRVLVVADPAEDAPLEGAEAEGIAVADLFEQCDTLSLENKSARLPRVEVTRLFGPRIATRTNVLRELISRPYDILHYAGHCYFNPDYPDLSGWIFTGMQVLSAHEMKRIDRVPRFIFSNACESGVTPDRAGDRNDRLAPSFAEAFFAQGVSNFVCTAWPVGDAAALNFALTLYQELLGLEPASNQASPSPRFQVNHKGTDRVMYRAMQKARLQVAADPDGRQTWGAYQHYGNPFFRLVE